ncbi:hypothetical protein [Sulfurimonas sp.]|uniref:hypothetical protein n=1 Tax=Sulfurimonas sp. TaxID=2022749 RepID=UPI003D0EDDB2
MVKKLGLSLGYFLVFVLALIMFTPKQSVYYFAEKKLQPFDVIISHESLEDNLFSLGIEHAQVYGQNIEAANVEKANVIILGLYNSVSIENVKLASFLESFVPQDVEHISINYSIINPLAVTISANGDFGVVDGELSLLDQNLSLVLQPSKLMHSKYQTTLREFKKQSNGEYTYAKAL